MANKRTNKQKRKYTSANPIINAQLDESATDDYMDFSIVLAGLGVFLILMGLFVL